jgi:hypothetical protein
MKIRSNRPGPLVIADAKLRLAPGEVVEAPMATPQLEAALKRGFVVKVDEETPVGAPEPVEPAPSVPADYERLSAGEAIEYIDDEDDPEKLKGILRAEKRKTVLDALRKKLQEVSGGAAQ